MSLKCTKFPEPPEDGVYPTGTGCPEYDEMEPLFFHKRTHSPEPWRRHTEDTELPLGGSSVKGPVAVVDANGEAIVPDTPWCPTGYDMDRIVACVNFCRGVPTQDMANLGTAGYPAYRWARELATRAAAIAVHGSFPGPKEFFDPGDNL